MKRQIVYIAGKYRARTKLGVLWNIYRARQAAIKWWQQGYAAICPHMNTALFDGKTSADVFLKGDLKILAKCHIVYALKGWQDSKGATAEINEAIKRDIRVIYEDEKSNVLMLAHLDNVLDRLEPANLNIIDWSDIPEEVKDEQIQT